MLVGAWTFLSSIHIHKNRNIILRKLHIKGDQTHTDTKKTFEMDASHHLFLVTLETNCAVQAIRVYSEP